MTDTTGILLWAVAPYVTLALLIGGTIWRYRTDRFGWTSRSSQLHESRILRVASPMFHFGLLFVLAGHLGGLFVPESLTTALGLPEIAYHWVSLVAGGLAGVAAVVGMALLVWRRWRTPAVRAGTTRTDRGMYVVLACALLAGLAATLLVGGGTAEGYDYRLTIAPWFRGIFLLHPQPSLMADVPLTYQFHTVVGMVLFCLWPFSRLVHAFSAPVHYLLRPYLVYRSRRRTVGNRPPRRGWDTGMASTARRPGRF